jgi:hypothetical protein
VLNGGTVFEVTCLRCAMRFVVDRIRDAEATAMADHLRERHPELRVGEASALGAVLEHYRVTPMDPDDVPPPEAA